MGPVLALDAGNSRVKWGLYVPPRWLTLGVTPNAEIGTLALRDWQNLTRPARVVGVNVAGEGVRLRIEALVGRWRLVPEWLTASAKAAGVVNSYAVPEQLGADRWAALVAARRRVSAKAATPPAAIVVNAGTAVTIDALDGDGVFRGGMILPGLRLMLGALADNTAALKVAPGKHRDYPTNTADALYTGALSAICGAIATMRGRLAAGGGDVVCVMSGGAAAEIAPHIAGGVDVVDNLVLDGVLALAGES
jgi:type III pantothenate kinase